MANGMHPRKSWPLYTCEVQDSYTCKMCIVLQYSPWSLSLSLHCFSLASRARAQLSVSPCNLLPLRWLSHMSGSAWPRLLAAHTPISLLSACIVSSARIYVCDRVLGATCWGCRCPALPAQAWAKSFVWTLQNNLHRKKCLNHLKMSSIHSLGAENSTWAGTCPKDPGQLGICWRKTGGKTLHSGEGIRHFRLPDTWGNSSREKYASLAVGHCKRGQVKTKICSCLYRRGILKCFLSLLSHTCFLFPLQSTESLMSNNLNQLQMFASDNVFTLHSFSCKDMLSFSL